MVRANPNPTNPKNNPNPNPNPNPKPNPNPLGAEIDEAEAVFRVNNCPTRGFEDLAGGRTTFRFLNSPRSMRWVRVRVIGLG